ncbi:MAG: efflux RND transporter periplasmic adaptor subunit [Isosphaeraceae bacterium]
MFLSKVKTVLTAAVVVAVLAAGAVAFVQSGIGEPKDGTSQSQHVGSPSFTYHILVSRDGGPPRKVAVVAMTDDTPLRVDAPGALILFQPKRVGQADRQATAERGDQATSPEENAANRSGANSPRRENDQEHRKIVLTRPKAMDVVITQPYICRINSQRHIDVRALEDGLLEKIPVREGEAVKKGDLMFTILPILHEPKPAAGPATVKAPFDGLVGRLHRQVGSLVREGDVLTTLSDNSVMWVFFNVPERAYLEYMATQKKEKEDQKIELELANHSKLPQACRNVTVEAQFSNETGNIAFRADFPNPDRLLRHGQTGTILIHRKLHDVTVIPQRATWEIMDKRYVYVVGNDDVVHRREIAIQHEMDDIFVIQKGVGVGDRIVLEGVRQVRDGEKVQYECRPPEQVMGKLKNHAE